MYKIDKVISIPSSNPLHRESVDLIILQACEELLHKKPFYDRVAKETRGGLSYVDKVELPARNGVRRFHVKTAYDMRDK